MLLFDFSHHNIEMACALLETCGRFLYRSHDSHHRTRVYLVSTVQPHYNAIFGVHRNRPHYKRNHVIIRLFTIRIRDNLAFGSHDKAMLY